MSVKDISPTITELSAADVGIGFGCEQDDVGIEAFDNVYRFHYVVPRQSVFRLNVYGELLVSGLRPHPTCPEEFLWSSHESQESHSRLPWPR